MYIVVSLAEKIQIHFIGRDNRIPSWVLCELDSEKVHIRLKKPKNSCFYDFTLLLHQLCLVS